MPPLEYRCPVCKARIELGPQCRRCKADLSLLVALEDRRARALSTARRYLARGQFGRALAIAEGADALRADDDTRRLRAVCRLLLRDFPGALRMVRPPRPDHPGALARNGEPPS